MRWSRRSRFDLRHRGAGRSTLVVHLTHPAGDLADLFAMPATAPIPPVPRSSRFGVAEGVDGYGRFLVASGPYMIEGSEDLDLSVPPEDRAPISGYVPGRSLTLVRNPSWERESDALRPAYVDRIEVTIVGGIGEAVRQVQTAARPTSTSTMVRHLRSRSMWSSDSWTIQSSVWRCT